ncbi:MAG: hypothetical protein ACLUD1_07065, partial [Clostridia bacterium]
NNLAVSEQIKSSPQNLSKGTIIEMSVSEISNFLKVREYQVYDLLLRKSILIKSYNDKLSSCEIDRIYSTLNKWYHSMVVKEKKVVTKNTEKPTAKIKKKASKKNNVRENVNNQLFLIDNILDHSIEDIARYVGQNIDRVIKLLKLKGITGVTKDTVLSTSDVMLIHDYLNNAFIVYQRKCKQEKEERECKGIMRRMVERYKPSFGPEGDYRRLIYIPTKT